MCVDAVGALAFQGCQVSLSTGRHGCLFAQGFVYINLDKEMQDPASKEFARARNTNLNEDLGKIDYVFSDKTGTLTSNEMQLREISIKGIKYGSAEYKCDIALCQSVQASCNAHQQMLCAHAIPVTGRCPQGHL